MDWMRWEFWKLVDWVEAGGAGRVADALAIIAMGLAGFMSASWAGSIVDCASADAAAHAAVSAVAWAAAGAACWLRVRGMGGR